MRESDRNPVLDKLKAIGIVLVVLGHAPGIPKWLITLIYSFHMPLFFFLSGYLMSSDRLRLQSWGDWMRRSSRTLLWPWLLFYLISWVYQLSAVVAKGDSPGGLLDVKAVLGFLMGNSESMSVNLVLWFFPALLLTNATFRILTRVLVVERIWIATTAMALAWIYLSPLLTSRLWWSADCVPIALCFFSWGHSISKYEKRIESLFQQYSNLLWGGAWLIGLMSLATLNGRVDLNGITWGKYPLLYLPTACWGIGGLWWIATHLPSSKVAVWLARNTLTIFPLHPLLFGCITGVGILVLHLPSDFQYTHPAIGILYVFLTFLLSYPSAIFLKPLLSR